ncbi:MAG: aldo/keto reductase [Lachnospiraceae bacterium]|nr:aldo/keto reductase [Lachnospiraceae bacterium]
MIHYIDSMADWKACVDGDVMRYALELKEQGVIGAIGLSSHNPEVALAAVESGLIEVLLFSINPCYDLQPGNEDLELLWAEESYEKPLVNMDPARQALYEACERSGVGITVMKAFGGGDLLSEELSPAGKALTAYQCIAYALDRPGVASVMAGARTVEELKTSLAYEEASAQEKDYVSAFVTFPKISWQGHCMYCGHCAPCPKGIAVAEVTKFLNLAIAQGELPETVREHYAVLPHKAGECIECGACESRCPFGVKIRENMKKAVEVFGE